MEWEHEGTAVVAVATASTVVDTMHNCPTTAAGVGAAVPQVACRPSGTLVVYLLNVLT
jgi:hypothetical protein